MNYYGAKQLVDGFRTVRRNTLQIAEDIPESRYAFAPIEGARTIARLLVRALIPGVAGGVGMDDIALASFDYSKLDRPGSGVRSSRRQWWRT